MVPPARPSDTGEPDPDEPLVARARRGDEGAVPVQLAIGAGAMGLLGLACVWGSRFFANAR